jgi:photosystem II stability/assembly factor-like uncharacterized protein
MPIEHEQPSDGAGQYAYPLVQNPVNDIFFLDGKHGWISGERGLNHPVLYRTEDGGDTWTELPDDPGIYKLFFLSASQGWALVVDWPRHDAVRYSLYETRDGGKSWSRLSTILQSAPGRPDMISDFLFVDSEHGWFVGEAGGGIGIALYSSDGGRSVHPVQGLAGKESLSSLFALGKRRLWAFGNEIIFASEDGGMTWHPQSEHSPSHSGAVAASGEGWAVGGDGAAAVLTTKDFGEHWVASFKSDEAGWLESASFWDELHGCAVGASTVLCCTDDGGKTWTTRRVLPKATDPTAEAMGINVDNIFTKIRMLNSKRGWVVSDGGALFETDDGGASWREVDLDRAADPRR